MAVVILNAPRPRQAQVILEGHRRPQVILSDPQRQLPMARVRHPSVAPVRVFSGEHAAMERDYRELCKQVGELRRELALADAEAPFEVAGRSEEELRKLFAELEERSMTLMKRCGEIDDEIFRRTGTGIYPRR